MVRLVLWGRLRLWAPSLRLLLQDPWGQLLQQALWRLSGRLARSLQRLPPLPQVRLARWRLWDR